MKDRQKKTRYQQQKRGYKGKYCLVKSIDDVIPKPEVLMRENRKTFTILKKDFKCKNGKIILANTKVQIQRVDDAKTSVLGKGIMTAGGFFMTAENTHCLFKSPKDVLKPGIRIGQSSKNHQTAILLDEFVCQNGVRIPAGQEVRIQRINCARSSLSMQNKMNTPAEIESPGSAEEKDMISNILGHSSGEEKLLKREEVLNVHFDKFLSEEKEESSDITGQEDLEDKYSSYTSNHAVDPSRLMIPEAYQTFNTLGMSSFLSQDREGISQRENADMKLPLSVGEIESLFSPRPLCQEERTASLSGVLLSSPITPTLEPFSADSPRDQDLQAAEPYSPIKDDGYPPDLPAAISSGPDPLLLSQELPDDYDGEAAYTLGSSFPLVSESRFGFFSQNESNSPTFMEEGSGLSENPYKKRKI